MNYLKEDFSLTNQTSYKIKLSVVIPCYCSEATIEQVVDRVVNTALVRYRQSEFEIILVNDCSSDNTERVIFELCDKYEAVQALSFSKNYGQQAALLAGMRESSGEIVVCLDDDGETPPEAMPTLIDRLGDDCDVAYASYEVTNPSAFRRFGTSVNEFMLEHIIGKPHDIKISSYVAMKRFIVEQIIRYAGPYPYITGTVLATTRHLKNVPVNRQQRLFGASGYNFAKLFALWMNGFTAYSVAPLRLAMWLGITFALLGVAGLIWIVASAIAFDSNIGGWQVVAVLMLIIGGCVLLAIGMIGEYVGRSYISTGSIPQYVIRRKRKGAHS